MGMRSCLSDLFVGPERYLTRMTRSRPNLGSIAPGLICCLMLRVPASGCDVSISRCYRSEAGLGVAFGIDLCFG